MYIMRNFKLCGLKFPSGVFWARRGLQANHELLDKLANMDDRIEEHFGSLTVEISRLSAELKEEVEAIKTNLKSVEQSLESAWDSINDLQEGSKTHSDFKRTSQQTLDSCQEEINLLKRNSASAVIQNQQIKIQALPASLEKEKEKIIALENYSRRENLRFMNIPERKDENCFDVIYDIIEKELSIMLFTELESHAKQMTFSMQRGQRPMAQNGRTSLIFIPH